MQVFIGRTSAEIIEKKSRFIGAVYEIHSEEEAQSILEAVRKEYWDARHNCYAYVVGDAGQIKRFSDDKEPQGTAGKPILEVLQANNLTNTLIIVTRYFGGILLGTGGLTRAYSKAAADGVKASSEGPEPSGIYELNSGRAYTVSVDYKDTGRIENMLSQKEYPVLSKEYTEKAAFTVLIADGLEEAFLKDAADLTNGTASVTEGEKLNFISHNRAAHIYKL